MRIVYQVGTNKGITLWCTAKQISRFNQTCFLQSTPLHSWYTAPNVFCSSGTCFAGWREGPVSNFLLYPLPSEIGNLLVGISTLGPRKSLQGPNLESRAALERSNSSWVTVTQFSFCAPVSRRGKNFAATWRIFSLSVKIRWHELLQIPTS